MSIRPRSDLTGVEQVLAKRLLFHSGSNTFTDQDLANYIESARLHLFSAEPCCGHVFDQEGTRNMMKTAFSAPYIHVKQLLECRSLRTDRNKDLVSLIVDNCVRSATGML